MRRRGERPGHSATTAHFQAVYPFLGMGGLGAPGVYVGTDAFGGAWAFDPWELYARRIMRSPNVIVLGGISYAKSTLIKTYIYRQDLFGRQAWVIDVKGEYGPLAAALDRRAIRLEPGSEIRLNPIERRGGREGQLALLRSVALAALRRDLHPEEDAALRVALDQVNEEAGVFEPTLPMVVGVLLHPREGIDLDGALVVLDLSAMRDSDALAVLMTCTAAWQQAILRERKEWADREGAPMAKVFCVFRRGLAGRRQRRRRRVAAGELQALSGARHRQLRLPPQADRLRHRRIRWLAGRLDRPGARRRRRMHRDLSLRSTRTRRLPNSSRRSSISASST
jgi:hypothetical protein